MPVPAHSFGACSRYSKAMARFSFSFDVRMTFGAGGFASAMPTNRDGFVSFCW